MAMAVATSTAPDMMTVMVTVQNLPAVLAQRTETETDQDTATATVMATAMVTDLAVAAPSDRDTATDLDTADPVLVKKEDL